MARIHDKAPQHIGMNKIETLQYKCSTRGALWQLQLDKSQLFSTSGAELRVGSSKYTLAAPAPRSGRAHEGRTSPEGSLGWTCGILNVLPTRSLREACARNLPDLNELGKPSPQGLQAGLCKQGFASRALQAGLCKQGFASRALQAGLCKPSTHLHNNATLQIIL